MGRTLAFLLAAAALGAGWAAAQEAPAESNALRVAKQQADEARRRSILLERQAERASGEAAKAAAAAAALAARIQAAEADITAAQLRIRLIERLQAEQRARLAERQAPLVRLTAALQTMGRRPPALVLVRPGSVEDLTHLRALLASTLPEIRARTAGLRSELARGERLAGQAEQALAALNASRKDLRERRAALARFEQRQRGRSEELMASALVESDRALAFGEEARELAALAGTREFQSRLRARLSELPGPALRPGALPPPSQARFVYRLPVDGRLVRGFGEISDAGVHARGLTFEAAAGAAVAAPAAGEVVYAGRFRSYGEIVIIEHGGGWSTTLTHLASLSVRRGDRVRMGDVVGRAAASEPRVGVELRRAGRPFPIAPLLPFG